MDARIEKLLSTETIRAQARRMLEHAVAGHTHFKPRLERLNDCADYVVDTIRSNYPDLNIPFHSRWGHFRAAGVDRVADLDARLAQLESLDGDDKVRAKLDLVVVSVLLDAGAGMQWRYHEEQTGCILSKSEGLAIASLHMFLNGAFSSDAKQPYRCDSAGLRALTRETLEKGFQVSGSNPLVGVEGRLGLLHALANALENGQEYFGDKEARIGNIVSWYRSKSESGKLRADYILRGIQLSLGSIWPGRLEIDGFNLGDVWRYPAFGEEWVPFHKLPQWLSYSMIEPLSEAGLQIQEADRLTGLAEYRNGGLFIDSGVLELRDPTVAEKSHGPDSELVVEWRALTIELLERLADQVRAKLGLTQEQFPLGKVLEGGTWAAGRKIAATKRKDGGPPLKIESDGTVF